VGGKKYTVVFNSKSRSSAIPEALKIAYRHRYESGEDGYFHVLFESWDDDLGKLLDLVEGLKGTVLIDHNGRSYASKSQLESIKEIEKRKKQRLEKEIEETKRRVNFEREHRQRRLVEQSQERFKHDIVRAEKEIQRLQRDVKYYEKERRDARSKKSGHLAGVISIRSLHCVISLIPFIAMEYASSFISASDFAFLTVFVNIFVRSCFAPIIVILFNAWGTARKKEMKANDMRENALKKLKELAKTPPTEIPESLMVPETLGKILQKGFSIRMKDVRALLGMEQEAFDTAIVDMAIEYGFWIDGDNLVFDAGKYDMFMDKVREIFGMRQLLERISGSMTERGRVFLSDLKEFTRLDAGSMDDQVIDWTTEFGFKIDGDELVLDPQKAAGFISVLKAFSPQAALLTPRDKGVT